MSIRANVQMYNRPKERVDGYKGQNVQKSKLTNAQKRYKWIKVQKFK